MNAGFDLHIPEDLLENYAMGQLSTPESDAIEEHLLICSNCMIHLDEVEEYIAVVRTAALGLSFSQADLPALDSVLVLSSEYSAT